MCVKNVPQKELKQEKKNQQNINQNNGCICEKIKEINTQCGCLCEQRDLSERENKEKKMWNMWKIYLSREWKNKNVKMWIKVKNKEEKQDIVIQLCICVKTVT